MIEFKNCEIGYKSPLLRISDLKLEAGVLYSLIGSNGSGKTTWMQSILGTIPFLSGEIFFQGKKLSELRANERAKKIAFVSSKFDGVLHLSCWDYIALGRMPHTNFLGALSTDDKVIVDKIIDRLNIRHLAQKDSLEMSDGERQIASIARALAQETPFILLDEPTAFLDYSNRIKILTLLREIAHEEQICVLQSSHDLELCLEYSDQFLLVDTHQKELLQREKTTKTEVISLAFGG